MTVARKTTVKQAETDRKGGNGDREAGGQRKKEARKKGNGL